MKRIIYSFSGLLLVLGICLLSSCEEWTRKTDVYVIGNVDGNPIMWKNGRPDSLMADMNTDVRSIFVTEKDVYILGSTNVIDYTNPSNSTFEYILRKNNNSQQLRDIRNVKTLLVNGNDVYIGGQDTIYNSVYTYPSAALWKNGATQTLPSKWNSCAQDMVEVNNNIYVLGYCGEVWKNGDSLQCERSCCYDASSLYVVNNDIYITGDYVEDFFYHYATFWKNDSIIRLSNELGSRARDICVDGKNIYIVGQVKNRATLWINGTAQTLSEEGISSVARSICVSNGDIYVLGEIVLTADKVEQGIYKNRIKSSSDNPTISTLKSTLNKMLDSVQDSNARILRVVSSYTNDDFTDSIKVLDHYKDDMKILMESINTLGNALSKNAKTNFSNGETLEKNSIIMTSSMNSLASKANDQAASLEETAAALEEITSITRNNAQNAAKMAELGQTVKRSVFTGEELASRTASSMDEINQKVNSINEAITVIDQIAFQTNILSLNAAEVRNLASRSADAAREIKNLVQEATVKANDGKIVSSDMIDGYKELNKNISETIHIIEDVSRASKEQMTGIEQINDAVNMLDRVTQENASEANNVKSIANNISLLANDLLNDAKSKKFN